jgi:hypothetical protein
MNDATIFLHWSHFSNTVGGGTGRPGPLTRTAPTPTTSTTKMQMQAAAVAAARPTALAAMFVLEHSAGGGVVWMAHAKAVKVSKVLAALTEGRAAFALRDVRALELVTATKGAGASGARCASARARTQQRPEHADPWPWTRQVLCADRSAEPQARQPAAGGDAAAGPRTVAADRRAGYSTCAHGGTVGRGSRVNGRPMHAAADGQRVPYDVKGKSTEELVTLLRTQHGTARAEAAR